MKPESLKNKLFEVPLDFDDTYYGIKTEMIKVATEGQIKSAVEWLKNKCYRHLIDGSMETRDNLNTFDMHELIDEAFEDVIKK